MKKLIVINGLLLVFYLMSNIIVQGWLDVKINDNFTAPYLTYSMQGGIYNVVNLGTSHGELGFDWRNTNNDVIKGLNLGLSGKPFKYDYFLLNYYENHIDLDAIILLPISFHSLCMTQDTYSPIDSVYNVKVPLFGMVRLNYIWDLLISYPKEYPNDEFNSDYISKSIIPIKCDHDILEKSINYISKIAQIYPNLVIITTPYYVDALAEPFEFNEFYRVVNKITTEYNLPYFDYSRDVRFNHSSFFFDTTHLNTKGRRLLTNIVIEEIIESYIN